MDLTRTFIALLRRHLGEGDLATAAVREGIRRRWEREIPRIAREMRRRHVTLDASAPPVVVRDALFRLWRSVIPSGDVADFVRDAQDDAILATVLPQLTPETPVRVVLEKTATAALELAF